MELTPLSIENLFLIQNNLSVDERGLFIKLYSESILLKQGFDFVCKESYYSISNRNVIRGMHFQTPPHDHSKIVHVVDGEILDVILDLRRNSSTFMKVESVLLNAKSSSICIPKGCAHGFLTKSDSATVVYYVSSEYSAKNDVGVLWESIGFDWGVTSPIISKRDKGFPPLNTFTTPF